MKKFTKDNKKEYYSIGETALMIGVSVQTLRNWDNENDDLKDNDNIPKLIKKNIKPAYKTEKGNRRYYSIDDIAEYLGKDKSELIFKNENYEKEENLSSNYNYDEINSDNFEDIRGISDYIYKEVIKYLNKEISRSKKDSIDDKIIERLNKNVIEKLFNRILDEQVVSNIMLNDLYEQSISLFKECFSDEDITFYEVCENAAKVVIRDEIEALLYESLEVEKYLNEDEKKSPFLLYTTEGIDVIKRVKLKKCGKCYESFLVNINDDNYIDKDDNIESKFICGNCKDNFEYCEVCGMYHDTDTYSECPDCNDID